MFLAREYRMTIKKRSRDKKYVKEVHETNGGQDNYDSGVNGDTAVSSNDKIDSHHEVVKK